MRSIHIFNEFGESVLSAKEMVRRIKELEAENHRLKRMIKAQSEKMRLHANPDDRLPEPVKH